ncbi:MAG: RNA ligase family protein, partial [Acidobacteria bacterium]|nr:RNA ligase family protein [Acidobacteriota bacterium]
PHLVWLGESAPRGDRVMDPEDVKKWLHRPASVEEKVDGANLGLSVSAERRVLAQSRGHYLKPGTGGQWKLLWRWLAERQDTLRSAIGPGRIAFGEWCYARHSVSYDALPDWFLLFDVYDRDEKHFWARERRDSLAQRARLSTVPLIGEDTFTISKLRKMLGRSHQIKHLDVLPLLATRVLVPPAVVDEVREGMRTGPRSSRCTYPGLGRGPAPRGRVRFAVGHRSRARRKRSSGSGIGVL